MDIHFKLCGYCGADISIREERRFHMCQGKWRARATSRFSSAMRHVAPYLPVQAGIDAIEKYRRIEFPELVR